MDHDDPRYRKALCRYQAISAYLALDPPRGMRGELLRDLASRNWPGPDGEPMRFSAETLRAWIRRYRRKGIEGLLDKRPLRKGIQAITHKQAATVIALKKDVPERSLDRLIQIAEETKLVAPGVLRRSTVHRLLQQEGLSARPTSESDKKDLDRFEALAPNDLWQSDMRVGPWLPDPERHGKLRRTKLFCFLDDHSRKLLHGRFSFAEGLPELELVFRLCLEKYGVPKRVYYDNGKVYRAGHMRHIVATLGIHAIVYTTAYRPEGHGKIEAFNRLAKAAFVAEVKASSICTLDELNEAFVAWMDFDYNQRVHGETGETPNARWRAGIDSIRYADDKKLHAAFRWKERRTPDKAGVFSLFGTKYQVGSELRRKHIDVYYDPQDLREVDVHRHHGEFVERVRPFQVSEHRRPHIITPEAKPAETKPIADYLGHLVDKRRRESFVECAAASRPKHAAADDALVDMLREHLAAAVFNEDAIRDYLGQYGPFDLDQASQAIDDILARTPSNLHVLVYLNALRETLR